MTCFIFHFTVLIYSLKAEDSSCSNACKLNHFSHVQLFAMLWTVAHQAPLSMGFSKQ